MSNRYERPPAEPPSAADMRIWLREAQPTIRERIDEGEAVVEARRANAVQNLLAGARAKLAEADEIQPSAPYPRSRFGALQPELRQFLKISGLRVLLADDPAVALKRFLGRKGRGRPAADNQFRDCMIAADVAELVSAETTIDAACNTIGDAAGLSPEAVRKIYFAGRETLEVKIELGFRAEAGNTPPGRTR